MSIIISEESNKFRATFKDQLTLLVKNASEFGMEHDVEFDTCIMLLQSVLCDQVILLDQAKKKLMVGVIAGQGKEK